MTKMRWPLGFSAGASSAGVRPAIGTTKAISMAREWPQLRIMATSPEMRTGGPRRLAPPYTQGTGPVKCPDLRGVGSGADPRPLVAGQGTTALELALVEEADRAEVAEHAELAVGAEGVDLVLGVVGELGFRAVLEHGHPDAA